MGRPGTFDSERARAAGKKSKRRPYDQIMRARLEKEMEFTLKTKTGQELKKRMTRDEFYDHCMDQIIARQETGAVAAVKEQRNRAYGQAPLHLKFDDDDVNPEEKIPLGVLKQIERLLEKSSRGD